MAVPSGPLWNIQPHTVAKHEILRTYLSAWFPILSTGHTQLLYIDGFCGPGRYLGGEDGSPIVALDEAIRYFDSSRLTGNSEVVFRFMDEDTECIDHLELILSQKSIPWNFKVETKAGEFADTLEEWLDTREESDLLRVPTFAFIDPFGFKGLPFRLVERLLRSARTEVLVNVMADSINRFLTHQNPKVASHIVDLFGTDDVLHIPDQTNDRVDQLIFLYQQQLQKCARFVRYFEMRNRNNRPIYYLFFATNHRLGHLKMKEAFWKVDQANGYTFSDATNPNQPPLPLESGSAHELSKMLISRYQGQSINTKEIRSFVEDDTVFLAKHMKTALKSLEKSNEIQVLPLKSDGAKRIAGTFPDEVQISFPAR